MNLLDFVKKNNEKKVDYDGRYGYQCVDLFRQYCKDVLNIPHTGGVVGAKDLWEKYEALPKEKKYFKKIINETPKTGDVVVFGSTKNNKYGHVAIVLVADSKNILVFEQDGFKQNGAKGAVWAYDKVLGFLRKRD